MISKKGHVSESDVCWPPAGKWKSPSLRGGARTAYLKSRNQPDCFGPGRPKVVHPVCDEVRAILKERAADIGPRGHDRFLPFRVEFSILFLATYSPSFVSGLLDDVFSEAVESGCKIDWSKTPPSVPTIRNAYRCVRDELENADLVAKIPREWQLLLSKYHLGPWHRDAPEWILTAYYLAGVPAPAPRLMTNRRPERGKRRDLGEHAEKDHLAFNPIPISQMITNQTREAAAAISPTEKTRRLARELAAIRKIFPDFQINKAEELLAWEFGLSAVREQREKPKSKEEEFYQTLGRRSKSPKKTLSVDISLSRNKQHATPTQTSLGQIISSQSISPKSSDEVPINQAWNENSTNQVDETKLLAEGDAFPHFEFDEPDQGSWAPEGIKLSEFFRDLEKIQEDT